MGPRATLRSIVIVVTLFVAADVDADEPEYGLSPSFRTSLGFASAERPSDVFGFAGHLSAGITFAPIRREHATNPVSGMFALVVDPLRTSSRPPGFVLRVSAGYDRTGPRGRAARDLVTSVEGGYGTALLSGTVGLGHLTGRVAGVRDRGLRTMVTLSFVRRIVFAQGAVDLWFGGTATEKDFRLVVGVDVAEFVLFALGE